MNIPKVHKFLVIFILLLAIISLLPGVATVWAEATPNLNKTKLDEEHLLPAAQSGVRPTRRPTTSFDRNSSPADIPGQDMFAQSDGSGVEIVPGAAFVHTGELGTGTEANDWFFDFEGGYLRSDSPINSVCLAAPVYLPPGNAIDSFTVYVYDNFPAADVTVYLDRTGFFGGWDELASVQSTNNSAAIQTLTTSSIFSENAADQVMLGFNYHVDFCLPAGSDTNIRLYGAQVNYSPPAQSVYLPTVIKSPPPTPPPITTNLFVQNNTGGVIFFYRIFDSVESGNLLTQCPANIQPGARVSCGIFTAGNRHVATNGECGPGQGPVDFSVGTCTRIVGCNRTPTTMQCTPP